MDEIKARLLSEHDQTQLEVIEKIEIELHRRSGASREQYIQGLVRSDILWHLGAAIKATNHHLLRSTLSCLKHVSSSQLFYLHHVASPAINRILQSGFLIAQSTDSEIPILREVTYTLYVILLRADKFRVPLRSILNVPQVLGYLSALRVSRMTKPTYIPVVARLLRVVLPLIDLRNREEEVDSALEVFQHVLEKLCEVAATMIAEKVPQDLEIIAAVSKLCVVGIKIAHVNPETPPVTQESSCTSDVDRILPRTRFILNLVCRAMINTVIPNSKIDDFGRPEGREVVWALAGALDELYQCPDAPLREVCWHLGTQGFLMYLLKSSNNVKDSAGVICGLLGRIITKMSEHDLALDTSSVPACDFKRKIVLGLLAHVNSRQDDLKFEALMFLNYFHYHGTASEDVIQWSDGVHQYISDIPEEKTPDIPTLQVLWFFFSISLLEHPDTRHNRFLSESFRKLIKILEKVGVERCYTYHPALVIVVLENSHFPAGIRSTVVKLWLKTDGDVHKLVPPRFGRVVVNCLLDALETGLDPVPKKAAMELQQMALDSELTQKYLAQRMWDDLPQLLAELKPENEDKAQRFLALLNTLSIDEASIGAAIECSSCLVKVTDECSAALSDETRASIILQATKVLTVGLKASDQRVAAIFLNSRVFLHQLLNQAVSRTCHDLSAVSYGCLAAILWSQTKFSIVCKNPVAIAPKDVCKMLLRKPPVNYEVMGFVQALWACTAPQPAIVLGNCPQDDLKLALISIYNIHVRHHRCSPPTKWEFTFACLVQLLRIYAQRYSFAVAECCDNVCNISLLNDAVNCKFFSQQFFDFVDIWLQFGDQFRRPGSFVEHALEPKAPSGKTRFISVFDVTMQVLNEFIDGLIASGKLPSHTVDSIKSILVKYV